jgi:hypothetical protein
MAEPTPKPGERWRVTIEGVVEASTGTYVYLVGGVACPTSEGTWERPLDPEPEWQPGDLVLDAQGLVYRRNPATHDYPWTMPDGCGEVYTDKVPIRPLRRLVVES